ncbi:unnamed protein product [Heligmosomoides polygyrus]|uniref:Secreted protein n=1 Tax=Heligmosomoides polygyrus TaxID=6339 RepID=A0A183FRH6_HELPZ|nr:unnamed protein product [Heligmosomoides polygyrus]
MVSTRSLTWTCLLVQLVMSAACLVASMAVIAAKLQSISIYEDKQFVRFGSLFFVPPWQFPCSRLLKNSLGMKCLEEQFLFVFGRLQALPQRGFIKYSEALVF